MYFITAMCCSNLNTVGYGAPAKNAACVMDALQQESCILVQARKTRVRLVGRHKSICTHASSWTQPWPRLFTCFLQHLRNSPYTGDWKRLLFYLLQRSASSCLYFWSLATNTLSFQYSRSHSFLCEAIPTKKIWKWANEHKSFQWVHL
jgi:hypothetical protein